MARPSHDVDASRRQFTPQPPFTLEGAVVLVDVPCPAFVGSELAGFGVLPGGVFWLSGDPGVLVVPVGGVALSGNVPVLDPLPIELVAGADDGDTVLSDDVPGVVAGAVDVDDDGLDIELSVVGLSALLHAPSAASVAAMATNWIERFMKVSSDGVHGAWAGARATSVGWRRNPLSAESEGDRRPDRRILIES